MREIERPGYSVCKLGKDRYFWIVYPSLVALVDGEPAQGEGYSTTRDEAERTAAAMAGPLATVWAAGMASEYHRRQCIKRRKERQSAGMGADVQEFLYADRSTPHRVVKKTASHVYVDIRPYRPDWRSFDVRTVRLDRAALERDGYAYSRVERDRFYTTPIEQRAGQNRYTPACLVTLGLTYPCQVEDVKRAYRRLAKTHHPDHGGDAAQFRVVQAAYEAALTLSAA